MTTLPSLEILKQHREELLLAEVAALLHDVGKFCDLHIEAHSQGGTQKWSNDHAYKAVVDNPAGQIQLSRQPASIKKPDALNNVLNAQSPKAADFLPQNLKIFLSSNSLNLLKETYTLAELIMLGTPGFATNQNRSTLLNGKTGWLAAVLGVCHNEAHVDKQEPARGEGQQFWPNVYISTAFGFEGNKVVVDTSPQSLDNRLQGLQPDRKAILERFAHALGDTRRPINEVLLSDWVWVVASLFKSAIAGALLKNQQFGIRQWQNWIDKIIDHDIRWRILRVNFDILGLYAKAVKIADLLAYQNAVDDTCAQVKQLVEEEYPLGNELYRDTTGIYFTFPDLDLPADLAQEIRHQVEEIEPELAPLITLTTGDGATAEEQLKGILGKARCEAQKDLAHPFNAHNLSANWQQKWDEAQRYPGKWEACPVCRLRPKAEHAEVCAHCDGRRQSRLQTWRDNPEQTIWLGEIADHNDRLALLIGKFGLDNWLSGDLVQTLLVKADPANNTFTPKNRSPARLRRVWEICQTFWQNTVLDEIIPQLNKRQRIYLIPDIADWNPGLYNGKVNEKPLDLYWQPEYNAFLTVSNLDAAGGLKLGATVTLKRPDNNATAETFAIREIVGTDETFRQYQPWLPLLTTPDQFLVLLPAANAHQIVQDIQQKYAEQFGKVRNRLPLFLGLVYFERKMPLQAVMDSARQMLDCPSSPENWQVQTKTDHAPTPEGWPRCVQLTLTREGKSISLEIPTVMGDQETKDVWYPYWRVEGKPTDRTRWFIGADGEHWAHLTELKPGDSVQFTPSHFDFLWLDAAARRFEVTYDPDARRPARLTRPFHLEDLERLNEVWKTFSKLSSTQLRQTLHTIERKREEWFGRDPDLKSAADLTFCNFVRDTLANAQWPKNQTWQSMRGHSSSGDLCEQIAAGATVTCDDMQSILAAAAVRGELSDLAELHLSILKEKPEEKE